MIFSKRQSEPDETVAFGVLWCLDSNRYTKALDNIKNIRKERAAELKAEKERLESLSREKGHADKMRTRISDLSDAMAAKQLEFEEAKKEYDRLVASNQKFYDSATKFRDIYSKVENLETMKQRFQEDLAQARENLQELPGNIYFWLSLSSGLIKDRHGCWA